MSHHARLTRQQGMSGKRVSAKHWMTFVVFVHLIVLMAHGAAHVRANVPLSDAAQIFVIFVIFVGPVAGLALASRVEKIGSWLVAITMAGAFVFGLVNHFLLDRPDHVANVAPDSRVLFMTSAILLATMELLGCALAIRVVRERRKLS